jgi:hypothetical protein
MNDLNRFSQDFGSAGILPAVFFTGSERRRQDASATKYR